MSSIKAVWGGESYSYISNQFALQQLSFALL